VAWCSQRTATAARGKGGHVRSIAVPMAPEPDKNRWTIECLAIVLAIVFRGV
jgi:hypothetical protein